MTCRQKRRARGRAAAAHGAALGSGFWCRRCSLFAVLIGLGVWQIQRKAWKEGLIAALTERLAAPPEALPAPTRGRSSTRPTTNTAASNFSATFDNAREALVFRLGDRVPPRRVRSGLLGVRAGAARRRQRGHGQPRLRSRRPAGSRNRGPTAEVAGPIDIVGAMRWPDTRHWFTPADDPAHNLWFARDPVAIAAAKNIGPVAPFYVEQEAPVPPGGLPQPGKLVVSLPDNHLQYAITWFGLAAVLAGVFISWAFTSRGRNGAGQAPRRPHRSVVAPLRDYSGSLGVPYEAI